MQIFRNGKANLRFCTKKLLVKRLRVIKLSLFIHLYYWRTDTHVFQFAWCWCFMEYLIFSTFSIQRFKNAKSSFSFVPNIGYLGLTWTSRLCSFTSFILWEDRHICCWCFIEYWFFIINFLHNVYVFVSKIGFPDLLGIKRISIYIFILQKDSHMCISIL